MDDLSFDVGAERVADAATTLIPTAFFDLPLTDAKTAVVDAFVREYIQRKLVECGGNVTHAATLAGQQRPNFKREMRRLRIEVDDSLRPGDRSTSR